MSEGDVDALVVSGKLWRTGAWTGLLEILGNMCARRRLDQGRQKKVNDSLQPPGVYLVMCTCTVTVPRISNNGTE
jgi:hypothetical protein